MSARTDRYLARHAMGWSIRRIAAHYHVTKQAVSAVLARHIPAELRQEARLERMRAGRR